MDRCEREPLNDMRFGVTDAETDKEVVGTAPQLRSDSDEDEALETDEAVNVIDSISTATSYRHAQPANIVVLAITVNVRSSHVDAVDS